MGGERVSCACCDGSWLVNPLDMINMSRCASACVCVREDGGLFGGGANCTCCCGLMSCCASACVRAGLIIHKY